MSALPSTDLLERLLSSGAVVYFRPVRGEDFEQAIEGVVWTCLLERRNVGWQQVRGVGATPDAALRDALQIDEERKKRVKKRVAKKKTVKRVRKRARG